MNRPGLALISAGILSIGFLEPGLAAAPARTVTVTTRGRIP